MKQATVRHAVWSTRRLEGISSGALQSVETAQGERLVALDRLGAGLGDEVLITCGTAAVNLVGPRSGIDAVIVAILDT